MNPNKYFKQRFARSIESKLNKKSKCVINQKTHLQLLNKNPGKKLKNYSGGIYYYLNVFIKKIEF